jgi:hypothetical protein
MNYLSCSPHTLLILRAVSGDTQCFGCVLVWFECAGFVVCAVLLYINLQVSKPTNQPTINSQFEFTINILPTMKYPNV